MNFKIIVPVSFIRKTFEKHENVERRRWDRSSLLIEAALGYCYEEKTKERHTLVVVNAVVE